MQDKKHGQKARQTVRRRRHCNERGVAMAEMAVVLPVVLTMMFGVIEGGRAIFAYGNVAHVAREATRYAIVRGSASEGQIATATDISNYAQTRSGISPITVTTTWLPDNKPGSVVQVTVQHTYTPVIPVLPSTTVSSTSRMVIY
jgi:Flp pilus assembly protein TadG